MHSLSNRIQGVYGAAGYAKSMKFSTNAEFKVEWRSKAESTKKDIDYREGIFRRVARYFEMPAIENPFQLLNEKFNPCGQFCINRRYLASKKFL